MGKSGSYVLAAYLKVLSFPLMRGSKEMMLLKATFPPSQVKVQQ